MTEYIKNKLESIPDEVLDEAFDKIIDCITAKNMLNNLVAYSDLDNIDKDFLFEFLRRI